MLRSSFLSIAILLTFSFDGATAQWVSKPGKGWVGTAVYVDRATNRFDSNGERSALLDEGIARSYALYTTAAIGVAPHVDIWLQAPIQRFSYDDTAGQRTSTGLGDLRFYARIAGSAFGWSHPIALRAGVKQPIGDFEVDAEIVPLSDGQRDAELILESATRLYGKTHVAGWVGHRWRFLNKESAVRPGNEWFIRAESTTKITSNYGIVVSTEWLRGASPVIQSLRVNTARRRLLQISPGVQIRTGFADLSIGVSSAVLGRNFNAGSRAFFALSTNF